MRRNVTNKEVENNVQYLLSNMDCVSLKSFSYVGSGGDLEVNLPSDCNIILSINGNGIIEGFINDCGCGVIPIGCNGIINAYYIYSTSASIEDGSSDNMHMFNTTNNKLIITSPYDNVLSTNGLTYKVYYL